MLRLCSARCLKVGSYMRAGSRAFSDQPNPSVFEEAIKQREESKNPGAGKVGEVDVHGNKRLYYKSQAFPIRAMLGGVFINTVFWGGNALHGWLHAGEEMQAVAFGMEPYWSYIGAVATTMMAFMAHSFSHGAIIQAYETADGKRVGFQMHNILGAPGRKFEVSIGKARLLDGEKYLKVLNDQEVLHDRVGESFIKKVAGNNQIPVHVDGLKSNVLLDKTGTYTEDYRIFKLLTTTVEEAKLQETNEIKAKAQEKFMANKRSSRKNKE